MKPTVQKKPAAPRLTSSMFEVQKITPKGINALMRGVRLNWVYVAEPKVDSKDPLKAQYRTQAILVGDAKPFITACQKACQQYLMSAKVAWGGPERQTILKTAFTYNIDGGLFKETEIGVTINTHSTVKRESEDDEFVVKYPPKLRLADGSDCPPDLARNEFYSGVYADLAVFMCAYDNEGRGLTTYLNGVRKLRDGEPLAMIDPFAGTEASDLALPEPDDEPVALPAPKKRK